MNRLTRAEMCLFVLLWVTFAYFQHREAGWNVNSRLALTYAIVERQTLRIDAYWNTPGYETHDVAVFNGHAYSDKSIGTSLLGIPAFAMVHAIELLRGAPFSPFTRRHLVAFFSTALLTAAAGVLFLRLARQYVGGTCGNFSNYPVLLTVGTFAGTMLALYANLFMSYGPATFFLLAALVLIERTRRAEPALTSRNNETGAGLSASHGAPPNTSPTPPELQISETSELSSPTPHRARRSLLIGYLLGWAILCEYLAGWAAVLLTFYYWRSVHGRLSHLAWLALGATLALAPFFLYTLSIFGRFAIPYEFEMEPMFREAMARGLMGATWPRLDVLFLITFHPYRGLFVQSPQLLLGVVGLACWLRWGARLRAATFAAIVLGYLLYNSGYYMWWGGWSFAPRHLAFAVPFLGLACAPLGLWRLGRAVVLAAASWGILVHTLVNAVEPQFPDRCFGLLTLNQLLSPDLAQVEYPWIFGRYIWRLFWQGHLEPNLGSLVGLQGPASLLPLMLFWAAMLAVTLTLARGTALTSSQPVKQ